MSTLFLAGGAEFTPCMRDPDLRLIELAGGPGAPIRILPAAAAPDNNHVRAGANGVRWFKSLGATDVETVFVIDRASAGDASLAASLRAARLVYLLGGFPGHLGETLRGSPAWESILQAFREGAVIAGSSAGAMVLCQHYYDPYEKKFNAGLGLLPRTCLIPHHNSSGARWHDRLRQRFPEDLLLGIDECTGILNTDPASSSWTVHGQGAATLYFPGQPPDARQIYTRGQVFQLEIEKH